jgi:uncharacterized protein YbaR (Trm112 family)
MAAHYDLDFLTFRCSNRKCREAFEKSLAGLAGADEVYCPGCGQAARLDDDIPILAAAAAGTIEHKAVR